MPKARSLSKVQEKTKGGNLHPKSRKFKYLNRATLREDKIVKRKNDRLKTREAQALRVRFFKEVIANIPDKDTLSIPEIKEIIKSFIARDDDQVDELKSEQRPGRPPSTKLDALRLRIEQEEQEFTSGFVVPDLTDKENMMKFRAWQGDLQGLSLIKMIPIPR